MHKLAERSSRRKTLYRVKNWAKDERVAVQRGSITFWLSNHFEKVWLYADEKQRARRFDYSDPAIEIILTIKEVFHLAHCRVQGMVRSMFEMLNVICQCLIQVAVLTENGISDNTVLKDVLAHIEPTLLSCVADEAYNRRKVYNALNTHPTDVEILIPHCRNAHL